MVSASGAYAQKRYYAATELTNQVNARLGEDLRLHYKARHYNTVNPLTTEKTAGIADRFSNFFHNFFR